ncbi:MAG: universal stress protein [Verrucomicrobiota bacterium]
MAKILACTDGSIYATSVYEHAAWASKKMGGASVHVLHMLNPHHEEPLTSDFSGSLGFGARTALLEELVELEAVNARVAQKRGQAILDDAELKLKQFGVTDFVTNQKHGKLSEEIEEYERSADLVVIGKRGNNANFETGHLGSNLERVIRSCQHPVLVASRAFASMQSFVIAFDGGASSQKAVEYIAAHPLLQSMRCYLLHVGQGNSELESALAKAESTLTEAGFEVAIEHRSGEPEEVINKVVEDGKIDLLVMGAYGHSKIRRLIVGSTTSAMIRTVQIPVLLFR